MRVVERLEITKEMIKDLSFKFARMLITLKWFIKDLISSKDYQGDVID